MSDSLKEICDDLSYVLNKDTRFETSRDLPRLRESLACLKSLANAPTPPAKKTITTKNLLERLKGTSFPGHAFMFHDTFMPQVETRRDEANNTFLTIHADSRKWGKYSCTFQLGRQVRCVNGGVSLGAPVATTGEPSPVFLNVIVFYELDKEFRAQ